MKAISRAILIFGVCPFVTSCSIDLFPVHYSKVRAAKRAEEPIKRGATAPGAFKKKMTFNTAQGYMFDPSQLEMREGVLKLKSPTGSRGHMATIQSSVGVPYLALDAFTETPSKSNQGKFKYQISSDGSKWVYYRGSKWVPATSNPSEANSADEINVGVGSFNEQVGAGLLYVRVFLISPKGIEKTELKEIEFQGIAPRVDSWD
jgi:hypothetical protein